MKREPDWEDVLRAAAALQGLIPGAVVVGGTAAALHTEHRRSLDADHVLVDLTERFDELLAFLEQRADWGTARVRPPVLILGNFQGVETGLRQLRRTAPLETEVREIETPGGSMRVRVPTLAEMLRIKAWLMVTRNAVRDHLDTVALADRLRRDGGSGAVTAALGTLDELYRDVQRGPSASPLLQLASQLADPRPYDIDALELPRYKGLVPRWQDWDEVRAAAATIAVEVGEILAASDDD